VTAPIDEKSPIDEKRLAEALRAALSEMGDVFSDLVATAESKSCLRCPYMSVERECTAEFACINQVLSEKRARPLCSGQHKINFSCPTAGAGSRDPKSR
jgi:hypothetical protein